MAAMVCMSIVLDWSPVLGRPSTEIDESRQETDRGDQLIDEAFLMKKPFRPTRLPGLLLPLLGRKLKSVKEEYPLALICRCSLLDNRTEHVSRRINLQCHRQSGMFLSANNGPRVVKGLKIQGLGGGNTRVSVTKTTGRLGSRGALRGFALLSVRGVVDAVALPESTNEGVTACNCPVSFTALQKQAQLQPIQQMEMGPPLAGGLR
ncbi:hypothetical protein PAAG_12170 [Paracoccidioides lutzii Pb01]|uniref:Uncharacterized protein n=1 Tax=Paracoccidioides lutzii (strain ATCC MYA-826 / Pb01) TaxID=502779 RepID=A0A0A2V459_PARBA|nr:hypothetical protein PAAG_12170 [Paracoccidioides lutzii Pb01]KGQ01132.1 hypothetical protein PAAG_12170 [Paracoccidioides lutzii Pb01]